MKKVYFICITLATISTISTVSGYSQKNEIYAWLEKLDLILGYTYEQALDENTYLSLQRVNSEYVFTVRTVDVQEKRYERITIFPEYGDDVVTVKFEGNRDDWNQEKLPSEAAIYGFAASAKSFVVLDALLFMSSLPEGDWLVQSEGWTIWPSKEGSLNITIFMDTYDLETLPNEKKEKLIELLMREQKIIYCVTNQNEKRGRSGFYGFGSLQ